MLAFIECRRSAADPYEYAVPHYLDPHLVGRETGELTFRSIKDNMLLATDNYPFLEVFWTMLIFFAFVVWIWILFTVIADLFRRHDTSGFAKVLWIVFIIVLPYFGVFVYLIAEHNGMTERAIKQQEAA